MRELYTTTEGLTALRFTHNTGAGDVVRVVLGWVGTAAPSSITFPSSSYTDQFGNEARSIVDYTEGGVEYTIAAGTVEIDVDAPRLTFRALELKSAQGSLQIDSGQIENSVLIDRCFELADSASTEERQGGGWNPTPSEPPGDAVRWVVDEPPLDGSCATMMP